MISELTLLRKTQTAAYLSISDKNAVSKQYGISSLYVFCPRKSTPSSINSQITNRRISPRYLPDMSFLSEARSRFLRRQPDELWITKSDKVGLDPELTSKACSPGLLDVSSTTASYLVRGRCSCLNESKAPWTTHVS